MTTEFWYDKIKQTVATSIEKAQRAGYLLVTDVEDSNLSLVEVLSENTSEVIGQYLVEASRTDTLQKRTDRSLEGIVQKPKLIPLPDTLTEYRDAFGMYKEQEEAIALWCKEHDQTHLQPGEETPYYGAIGGNYTYEFTPTSLGVCLVVTCSCGAGINVTDYDQW